MRYAVRCALVGGALTAGALVPLYGAVLAVRPLPAPPAPEFTAVAERPAGAGHAERAAGPGEIVCAGPDAGRAVDTVGTARRTLHVTMASTAGRGAGHPAAAPGRAPDGFCGESPEGFGSKEVLAF
ncbi:hypothetical protein V1L54_00905 [Streptomyces sp. TRM 70361]|uniref:hypothetical protein n=1 Tax=Streptomyces sp. TRM 70361 TaxID=3116553 RepID=UPI002E7BB535|nr:hypothetical protein [Streptomyces sp. TRM 70361]MEE1937989.1 hypothetical protein [Streptomyces sp. TRM 70361]